MYMVNIPSTPILTTINSSASVLVLFRVFIITSLLFTVHHCFSQIIKMKSPPFKTMEFPMLLLKLAEWFLYRFLANSCYKAAMKVKNHNFFLKNSFTKSIPLYPNITKYNLHGRESQTLVFDFNGGLLKSQSFFPYFMLVAFEGGSIFRAFILLLSYPFIYLLDYETKMKIMIFITFSGLKIKHMENVSRAVLPKFYLENIDRNFYEVLESVGGKVVITSVPRVMVEGFCKEYLSVDCVMGTELCVYGEFFTGLVSDSGLLVKHRAAKEFFGDKRPDLGIGTSRIDDHLLMSLCKEAYVISKDDTKSNQNSTLPRDKYPKPLIFHDGRLAFLPTPFATLSMFIWLPFGIFLGIFRLFVGTCLPYKLTLFLSQLSGIKLRVKSSGPQKFNKQKGVLYVCTHRTLLDPVFLSTSIMKPLTAVTYSVSKMSEIISPIKTVRLTRVRTQDSETMKKLLTEGDIVVCPEGTTCREPYLLRFSSLFAELADDIVPVAMNTHVTMFYGTTASGLKCLDPIFFMMNPRPCYSVQILDKVPREMTCAGGRSGHEVANYLQRLLGDALGFECTGLTRRDKYLMLAGNEGVVQEEKKKKN